MKNLVLAAAVTAILSACGGGGGSSDSTTTTPTPTPSAASFNLDAAVAGALTKGWGTSSLSGQISGQPYTMSVSFTPLADGTINGTTYKRALQTAYVWQGNTGQQTANATLFFSTGPALIAYEEGLQGIVQSTLVAPLPTAGTVGQSGVWSHGAMLSSLVGASQTGTTTTTWSLEPDAATTAWGCLTFDIQWLSTGARSSEKDCYRIDQAGTISGAKFTSTQNGQTVTFQ